MTTHAPNRMSGGVAKAGGFANAGGLAGRAALLLSMILAAQMFLLSEVAMAQYKGVQPIFNNQGGGWTGGSQKPPGLGGSSGVRPPGSVTVPIPIYPPYFRPTWPYPYGYNPYYNYGYSYGYPQYSQPVVVVQPQIVQVPVFVPVGPQANGVAGGVPAAQMPLAAPRKVAPRANPLQPEEDIVRRVAALKASDAADLDKADLLIAEGDREFTTGEYRRAMFKYRDATRRAQDYAPAHFRAGHVHTVLGDYELAVTDFGMALEIARTIEQDGFSFDTLYRGDAAALQEHLAELDGAIRRQPADGGLQFLMGMSLHYGGNPPKALEYFRRAVDLPGPQRPYAAMYLPAPAAAPPPAPGRVAK